MKREVDLSEISDGKLYGINDMVKADCKDCRGCSDCCQGMGQSVTLDPLDCYRLCIKLSCTMETLLQDKLELNVVGGIVLPNLKMAGEEERCSFLSQEGRCQIHSFRPGICRLFPLGRVYEEQGIRYFLQLNECKMEGKSKVKVKKWLDTTDVKQYEIFVFQWYRYLKDLEKQVKKENDPAFTNQVSMHVLKDFYLTPYDMEQDFFSQFERRLEASTFL
jgi:Fe-S-cluster containining protein